jgi:hypothetical protein
MKLLKQHFLFDISPSRISRTVLVPEVSVAWVYNLRFTWVLQKMHLYECAKLQISPTKYTVGIYFFTFISFSPEKFTFSLHYNYKSKIKCVRKSASEKVRPKKSYFLSAWEYVKFPFSLRVPKKYHRHESVREST